MRSLSALSPPLAILIALFAVPAVGCGGGSPHEGAFVPKSVLTVADAFPITYPRTNPNPGANAYTRANDSPNANSRPDPGTIALVGADPDAPPGRPARREYVPVSA